MGVGVADDRFRCGNRLIEPGMNRAEVGKTEVQRWTYASYSATRVLVFDQDTLKAIE